eukprot:TRINITY_DN1796_c0_g1_i1.p1 TRINITY_DN1796_c0_g1~~TRINITY_DN1796_c0_g1_i1.p1  ORF type:complete len:2167 (-),score=313.23 TRINITY_DN1796_c0_g1_i1:10945-17445(-)
MLRQKDPPGGENDRQRVSSALPPATVRKRLFPPTPITSRNSKAFRPSLSSSSAAGDNHKDIMCTPLPPLPPSSKKPVLASSSRRRTSYARPSIASLKGTPSIRKRYVEETPEIWLQRQVDDLTAWLNHELGDLSESPSYFPTSAYAASDVFLASYASILRFCNDTTFKADVQRLGKRVSEANLSFSPEITLTTEPSKFEQFVSLLTFSYNSTWLLLGLSVILRTNFAIQIDQILQQTENTSDQVDIAALQNELVSHVLRTQLVLEKPGLAQFTLKSPRATFVSPAGTAPVKQNGLVLHRALLLILLLDQASRDRDVINNIRIPLFKSNSSAHKSQEIMDRLSKICMSDSTPLNRFLSNRGFRLQYECPEWNRHSSFVVRDLSTDLRDGMRLCKVASLLTGDPQLLQQVKFSFQSHTNDTKRIDKHSLNVMMALDSIKSYASKRLGAKVCWNASVKDIMEGNVSKTVALLWQVVELWIEAKLLDRNLLQDMLVEAQNEFRSKAADATWSNSPGAFRELSPSIKSPSRLVIYEHSDKDCIHKLLMWCSAVCGIHRIKVVDFTESFRDCVVPCILLNHLYPRTVDMDVVTRVAPAELRDEHDAMREFEIVESNIAHFERACQRLGAMPNIPISAKASLAPAFISELKEESFGRLMVLMTAYIFNRVQFRKQRAENFRYVHQFAKGWEEFNYTESPSEKIAETELLDSHKSLTPSSQASSEEHEEATVSDEELPALTVASVDRSSPLTSQTLSNEVNTPRTAVIPVANSNSTTPVLIEGDFTSLSRSGQSEQKRKQKAEKVIFSNYKAFQVRKQTITKNDNIITLQNVARGFLARCDHEDLIRRRAAFAKSLESEFWNRKSLVQSEELCNDELLTMQEERKFASNCNRLCSKSLEDVGKAMMLLPSHMKRIDEYVQSMLSHEQRLQNEQTEDAFPIVMDISPDMNSRITRAMTPNDRHIINGGTSMVTVEGNQTATHSQETPTSLLRNVSIHTASSPGGESQVYRTPWTTFRPRSRIQNYVETPSDRFSWYTASPMIEEPNIFDENTCEEATYTVQPQGTMTREDEAENSNVSGSRSSEITNDHHETVQTSSGKNDHALAKGFLSSAVATIGRAAYEYLLNRNELVGDIVNQAAHDADVAIQVKTCNQLKTQDSLALGEVAPAVSHASLRNRDTPLLANSPRSDRDKAPSPSQSDENIGFVHEDQSSDSGSPRSSVDPGGGVCHLLEIDEEAIKTASDMKNETATDRHIRNTGPETVVDATENEDANKGIENYSITAELLLNLQGPLDLSSNQRTSLDSAFQDYDEGILDRLSQSSSEHPVDRELLMDNVKTNTKDTCVAECRDVEGGSELSSHGPSEDIGELNLANEEIRRHIEGALFLAETAFENHISRAQARLDFNAKRRIEIDRRYKELDQASSASMKRLRHEEERLTILRETLDMKSMSETLPLSVDFDSEDYNALLQDESFSESHTLGVENEFDLDFVNLDGMLHGRIAEDDDIDRKLSQLESDRTASCLELNNYIESLRGTILTVSHVLAELSFAKHMKGLVVKRERERRISEQERSRVKEMFQKSMWDSKMKLARIEEDNKDLDDAITALDERLEDTGSTVFQLLEADIDSRLMLFEHAEDKELDRLRAHVVAHEKIWSDLLKAEGLIASIEELQLPELEGENIATKDCELCKSGEPESNESITENALKSLSTSIEGLKETSKQVELFHEESEVVVRENSTEVLNDITSTDNEDAFLSVPDAESSSETQRILESNTFTKTTESDGQMKAKDQAIQLPAESEILIRDGTATMSPSLQTALYSSTSEKRAVEVDSVEREDENRDPYEAFMDKSSQFNSSKIFSTARRSTSTILASVNVPFTPAKETKEPEEAYKSPGSSLMQNDFEAGEKTSVERNRIQLSETKHQTETNNADEGDNLEDLSLQLSAFKITSSRKSVEDVMSNPNSAGKLRALIRRISTATASPVHRMSASSKRNSTVSQSFVYQNIIRTILVVMRHLHRTATHIRLIDLGMRIVRDFCDVQNRVADLVSVANCIDVLVTCAQFYRDQENILQSAISILQRISDSDDGLVLMRKHRVTLRRLEAIDHLLETAAEQERKNQYRVQYAKMIVEQVRLSRARENRRYLLRDHLAVAERSSVLPKLRIRPSHTALISLLTNLKSREVL